MIQNTKTDVEQIQGILEEFDPTDVATAVASAGIALPSQSHLPLVTVPFTADAIFPLLLLLAPPEGITWRIGGFQNGKYTKCSVKGMNVERCKGKDAATLTFSGMGFAPIAFTLEKGVKFEAQPGQTLAVVCGSPADSVSTYKAPAAPSGGGGGGDFF